MTFLYSYPFINLLNFDIKNIIGEYMYGSEEYMEIVNDIDNLEYDKSKLICKIYRMNERIHNISNNDDNVDIYFNLLDKYFDLIYKIYDPIKNNLPLMDYSFEYLNIINYPFVVCDENDFIYEYIIE